MFHRVLLIEQRSTTDDQSLRRLLDASHGYECLQSTSDALTPETVASFSAEVIVADAASWDRSPLSLFEWLRGNPIHIPTFAILPCDPPEELFHLVCETADDFMLWPVRAQELLHRLERIIGPRRHDPESIRKRLEEEVALGQLIGESPSFTQVLERIRLIAGSDAPALITGETGTGKELSARAIHHLSRRNSMPFIPVDCGAVPEALVENELFGHVRGAFTDAHKDQKGLVAMADGGTLFLDEVDALSPAAQAKLLRFLQEGTYRPLGADRFARADVRVIAATNRELEDSVKSRLFRADLYFRINVLGLHLPPLRERPRDVELLARRCLENLVESKNLPRKTLSMAALRRLEQYNWPGNVRELFNVVQRAYVFCPSTQLLPEHLPLPDMPTQSVTPKTTSFRQARAHAIEAFEKVYVAEMLRKHRWNITRGAQEAGKDRRAFGRLVKKYNFERKLCDE
jgi:DNA-binding NtrC family response regulator